MKFYCDIPGLTNNWVEVSEAWRRAESNELRDPDLYADFDRYWKFFAQKVDACYLVDFDGNVAESVEEITQEFYENCDRRLTGFLGGVLVVADRELQRLGNLSARLSGKD